VEVNMGEKALIVDFELKEDLLNAIKNNPDIILNKGLDKQIDKVPFGTLLEIEKEIGSNITILSIKEVNEKLLASAFN
jgi:hypothetical protein